uniref:Retroviral polymerase SH3-like domain-containing protein n=1 Tax=Tanacetum cinerariifolium TaxID=118510 RepID=A0A6L2LIL3_TANCI|nr:hypothetical protein [Tanacetum cinerariifolium]
MKNREVEVKEHHMNLLLSNKKRPISSECNNIKLVIQNDKSEVVCAMCKRCLITANHDVCVRNYVNDMNSSDTKQSVSVSKYENQKKHKPNVKKPKKVGFAIGGHQLEDYLTQVEKLVDPVNLIINPTALMVVQICLWCIDSGCSKHMTCNLKLLINFAWKALCYPKNDSEDLGKLGAKGDIGFFIGYSANYCAYRVYNRRTKKIMETMNVIFDELSAMDFKQSSSKPRLQSMTFGQISSGLDLTYAPSTITSQKPTERNLDLLFKAMYDDYNGGQLSTTTRTSPAAQAHQDVDELEPQPQPQHAQQQDDQALLQPKTVVDNVSNAMLDGNTFVNPFVLTRNQLRTDGDMCMYTLTVSTMELSNVKQIMTDPAWIDSMQEELLQFKRLDVWELVLLSNNVKALTLKWLFKNKLDEETTVIKNKTRLVVRGYFHEERSILINPSLLLLGWKLSGYFWHMRNTNHSLYSKWT